MFRRTFLSLFGLLPSFSLFPLRPIKKDSNGIWEAPGFYVTFTCMNCGRNTSCNNLITTCSGCKKSHFCVTKLYFMGITFCIRPPKENCTMAKDACVVVQKEDSEHEIDIYVCGENHRPQKMDGHLFVIERKGMKGNTVRKL